MTHEVKITKRYLKNLERAYSKLEALEAGGVCDWEWYDESLKDFRKEEQTEELIENYVDSILTVCSEEGDVEYPAGRECGHNILPGDAEDTVISLLRKFLQEAIELKGE